jgi:hypothetical protein
MICTVHPPSNDVRACAVRVAATAAIATVTAAATVESETTFMTTTLDYASLEVGSLQPDDLTIGITNIQRGVAEVTAANFHNRLMTCDTFSPAPAATAWLPWRSGSDPHSSHRRCERPSVADVAINS